MRCPRCQGTGTVPQRSCERCGTSLDGRRLDARWCTNACKMAALRDEQQDFKPGDVVVRKFRNGGERRWVVQNPVRTSRGKLRVKAPGAKTVATTWWHPARMPTSTEWRIERA